MPSQSSCFEKCTILFFFCWQFFLFFSLSYFRTFKAKSSSRLAILNIKRYYFSLYSWLWKTLWNYLLSCHSCQIHFTWGLTFFFVVWTVIRTEYHHHFCQKMKVLFRASEGCSSPKITTSFSVYCKVFMVLQWWVSLRSSFYFFLQKWRNDLNFNNLQFFGRTMGWRYDCPAFWWPNVCFDRLGIIGQESVLLTWS